MDGPGSGSVCMFLLLLGIRMLLHYPMVLPPGRYWAVAFVVTISAAVVLH